MGGGDTRAAVGHPLVEARPARVGMGGPGADTLAIVVAGGTGERFGDPRGKQFVPLCGLPMVAWSLLALDRAPSVAELVVVCAPSKVSQMRDDVLATLRLDKPVTIAPAGATRQGSVYAGLTCAPWEYDLVAVHDAARPLVETSLVEDAVARVRGSADVAGAILATPSVNTLKIVEGDTVVATPERGHYWEAQTPQVFRRRRLLAAHRAALRDGYAGTDDASLVERLGGRVVVVPSGRDNIKVTVPGDLAVAEAALQERLVLEGCGLGPEADGDAGDVL